MKDQLITKMVLDTWYSTVNRTGKVFDKLSDEQMLQEVSPGKNRGIYLLGHLTAVNDSMLVLLNMGEQLHPELNSVFTRTPDNAETQPFSVSELHTIWTNVNASMKEHFDKLTPDEWLQKHNSISEEDFAKEPHRNKLNVVINRTNHISYHLGQLSFL